VAQSNWFLQSDGLRSGGDGVALRQIAGRHRDIVLRMQKDDRCLGGEQRHRDGFVGRTDCALAPNRKVEQLSGKGARRE
jgi:hypothetical protein